MDLTNKTLWQVGAGDTERSYGEICIKFDMMIAGPGEPSTKLDDTFRACVPCYEGRTVSYKLPTSE